MRYSREHKLETHARIVKKASVRLREKGAHGIGVADLMKDAGLTHGGFYAHFDSREALVIEAFAHAMDRSTDRWRKLAEQTAPEQRLAAIVDSYLTPVHCDIECGNRPREPADPQGVLSQAGADDRHAGRADFGCSAQGRAQAGDGCHRHHDGNAGAGPGRRQWRIFRRDSRRRPRGRAGPRDALEAGSEEIRAPEGCCARAALSVSGGNRMRRWS
jgi:AcrR family transcriptional regulator